MQSVAAVLSARRIAQLTDARRRADRRQLAASLRMLVCAHHRGIV